MDPRTSPTPGASPWCSPSSHAMHLLNASPVVAAARYVPRGQSTHPLYSDAAPLPETDIPPNPSARPVPAATKTVPA